MMEPGGLARFHHGVLTWFNFNLNDNTLALSELKFTSILAKLNSTLSDLTIPSLSLAYINGA